MRLHALPKQKGTESRAKRVGRGYGTGKGGHTVGRGTKGQKSRTGGKIRPGFSGGQTPLYKSLPKYRGFKADENKPMAVNLEQLNEKYSNGDTVTVKDLQSKGLLRSTEKAAKILGYGEITKKLTIKGIPLSKSAEEKIIKAGGSVNA